MNILIVEDELPIALHVKKNFESCGYVCQHVDNGEEAIEAILIDVLQDAIVPFSDPRNYFFIRQPFH